MLTVVVRRYPSGYLSGCLSGYLSVLLLPLSLSLSFPAAAQTIAETHEPVLQTFVEPVYPDEGRREGKGGTVRLRLHIDVDGRVTDARVESGIDPIFDEAALAAGRKLRFDPAHDRGRPVPATVSFEYRFTPPGHTHAEPAAAAPHSHGDLPGVLQVEGIERLSIVSSVETERPLSAASARSVRDRDLKLRPIQRPADLFRVTPGLMIVQHAGGGKANQYLLRGFDADHGTDVALSLDGVPLNMVSHGHGQGYADPNFIIPELVERVEVSKGPYSVEHGDFASAGSVELITRDRGESFVSAGGGSFDTARAVAIATPRMEGALRPLLAAEIVHTDGPFQHPERFRKYNLFGKLTYDLDVRSRLSLTASAYNGSWNASGQLPARAVAAGQVDFFGSLDPTEGGTSSRKNVYLQYRLRPDAASEFQALAYLSSYDFTLTSNFTFASRDPANGDQIEQWDGRTLAGGRVSYRWLRQRRGILFDSSAGGQARTDAIANGLAYTRSRERLSRVVDGDIDETSVGAWAKEEIQLHPSLRIIAGLRADHFTFRVNDRLEDLATQGSRTSGAEGASRLSPKASLVLSPHSSTDVFVNFGYGFHSNDARGVVRSVDRVTPLTGTMGYELGARTRLLGDRLEMSLALWGLDIDSEIVWVGDEGTTEASGSTRRLGVEWEGRLQILPWLFADTDVTWADARFRENAGNGQAVALAPRLTIAGGLSAQHVSGVRAGLRGLHIAERPATEDELLKADATTLIDLFAAYRWRSFEASLVIENLIDRRYKSAQFATVTRLPNEAPTSGPPPAGACPAGTRTASDGVSGNFQGCEDVSFSPGNPFGLRLMATYYF